MLAVQTITGPVAAVAGGFTLFRLVQLRPIYSGLSVRWTLFWWLLSASFVLLVGLAGLIPELVSPAAKSILHYLLAVLMMTPAVSTLGARRHGLQAWQLFVVIPLILVLMWPVAAELFFSRDLRPLLLAGPAQAGYLAVLLMSAGPGLGGALTIACLMRLAASLVLLAPAAAWTATQQDLLPCAALLLLAEAEITLRQLRGRTSAVDCATNLRQQTAAVWLLFQDLYGPVWAQRFMNRMAQFERAERWSCSLQRSGFVGLNEQPLQDVDLARPLESFRWVISRFAESEWLERHLPFVAAGTSSDSPDAPPC